MEPKIYTEVVKECTVLWEYDLFPYYLSGNASKLRIYPDGRILAFVDSYSGWFNAFSVMPGHRSEEIESQRCATAKVLSDRVDAIKKEMLRSLASNLPQLEKLKQYQ